MKIIALNGLLGYGYSEESLACAFREPPDYVGVDAGSSDPGPYYLGSGTSFTDRSAVKRDVRLALPLALRSGAPLIVGTAGGAGSAVHLDWLRDIVLEIAAEEGISFRMALIYTDVSHEYVLEKYRAGKLRPMGPQLELGPEVIRDCSRIVSQIGAAPFIKALEQGAQVILAGRACDTAIYAAPCLLHGFDAGLACHMAKIMECGALCALPASASDVMQAVVGRDYFDLTPANPARRCTVERAAAHTMYEQSNPYLIYEPDGVADVRGAQYEQLEPRTVRVRASKFTYATVPTLKLEGARLAGYRTFCVAGISDPETAARLDSLFEQAKAFAAETMRGCIPTDAYTVHLLKYGALSPLSGFSAVLPAHGMGLVLDVVGKTQEIADTVCALIRARLLHADYEGRKSTAGNLAFPFSPSDIHAGPVYTFGIYHLAEVDDLCETSRIVYREVGTA